MLYQYIRNDITTGHLKCNIKRSIFWFKIKPTIPPPYQPLSFCPCPGNLFPIIFWEGKNILFDLHGYVFFVLSKYRNIEINVFTSLNIYSYDQLFVWMYRSILKWKQNTEYLASCYSKYCKDMQKVLFKYKRKYIHLKMIKKTKKRKMSYLPLNIILWITQKPTQKFLRIKVLYVSCSVRS